MDERRHVLIAHDAVLRLFLTGILAVGLGLTGTGGCAGGGDGATGDNNGADQQNANSDDGGDGTNDNGSFEFVLGTTTYAPPDADRPAKGSAWIDPSFGTTLVRMTDRDTDDYSGPGIQNEYSKMDPENADGTMVVLRSNNAAYYLYDASTYEGSAQLTVFDACGQEPEPRWDPTDPQTFYYVCNSELRSYNVQSGASTLVHDFEAEFPAAAYVRTKVEGDASLDRRYWAFLVEDESWNLLAVVVYDRANDQVVGQKTTDFREGVDWVGMSMSGEYCALGWEGYVAPLTTTLVSRDFNTVIDLPDGSAGHGDFALTADGRDVYVYQNVRTDYIAMADAATGVETPLVAIPFEVNPDIGMHISGNAAQTPGWVLVSTYGSLEPPPGSDSSWMDAQLFLLELTANRRIWRLVHTHSYISRTYTDEKNYFAEAFAALNTAGTRVYFGSNWGDLSVTDYTDGYVVLLPAGWIDAMPAD